MPKVVGVRFRTSPKMYWFAPTGDENLYCKGAEVIVETQRGMELATVIMPPDDVAEERIVSPLKNIVRMATDDDLRAAHIDDEEKRNIIAIARQKIAERGLDMKVTDCEYTVDHSKLVLYFTAEQRVDFRELVRDLASAYHMRIDLRQIGAREECKLIGALGPCGLKCCCGGFESDSEHVSIKMAKNQNLALTPGKINGMCGRLLCCLGYENKFYEDVLRRAPKHGSTVTVPDGRRGTVVSVTPLTETVRVKIGDDENFEFAEFPMSELGYERRAEENKPQQSDNKPNANNSPKNKNRKNNGGQASGDKSSVPGEKSNQNRNNNVNRNNDGNGGNHGGNGDVQGKNKNNRNKDFRRKSKKAKNAQIGAPNKTDN